MGWDLIPALISLLDTPADAQRFADQHRARMEKREQATPQKPETGSAANQRCFMLDVNGQRFEVRCPEETR